MNRWLLSLIVIFVCYGCSSSRQLTKAAEQKVFRKAELQTAHIGISVYDPATGKYLYNHQGEKYFVPASNTKIPTCYVAMKYLGDSLKGMRYGVDGESIIIEPTGDPTFLHKDFKQHPVYDQLKAYKKVVIQQPLFDDFLGSGWSWNDYKEGYMAQRSNLPIYGNTVRLLWRNDRKVDVQPAYFNAAITTDQALLNGFAVEKPWEENRFILLPGNAKNQEVPFRPNIATIQALLEDTLKHSVALDFLGKRTLTGVWHSQPTDSMLKPMMHRSDNFFAEQSLLMVSNEVLGILDDARIIDTILQRDFKDLPQKPRWVDGSGLSRYNLFTPQDFIMILDKMKNEFGMERIKEVFPSGNEGTLTNYYQPLQGKLFAKTGTLSGVVALSGYLYTRKNKLLLFSVLVNNHQTSAANVRRAVEQFLNSVYDHN